MSPPSPRPCQRERQVEIIFSSLASLLFKTDGVPCRCYFPGYRSRLTFNVNVDATTTMTTTTTTTARTEIVDRRWKQDCRREFTRWLYTGPRHFHQRDPAWGPTSLIKSPHRLALGVACNNRRHTKAWHKFARAQASIVASSSPSPFAPFRFYARLCLQFVRTINRSIPRSTCSQNCATLRTIVTLIVRLGMLVCNHKTRTKR